MNFRAIAFPSVGYRINLDARAWTAALDAAESVRTGERPRFRIRHRMQLNVNNGVGAFIEAGRSNAATWEARARGATSSGGTGLTMEQRVMRARAARADQPPPRHNAHHALLSSLARAGRTGATCRVWCRARTRAPSL